MHIIGPFILIVIALAIFLIPVILYLLTLQNTLKKVKKKNRTIEPGQVWLNLIPLFNIVWQFIMINRIADSLKAEFSERNISIKEDRPGAQIGVAYCILNLCGFIPVLGGLASLAGLVCWIVYWVKISNYKNQLGEINEGVLDDNLLDDFDIQA
jgi:hypothetical protein